MKTSRFSEEQIASILQQAERDGITVEEVCRKHGIHKETYCGWKKKFGGMEGSDVARLRALETENNRLNEFDRLIWPTLAV